MSCALSYTIEKCLFLCCCCCCEKGLFHCYWVSFKQWPSDADKLYANFRAHYPRAMRSTAVFEHVEDDKLMLRRAECIHHKREQPLQHRRTWIVHITFTCYMCIVRTSVTQIDTQMTIAKQETLAFFFFFWFASRFFLWLGWRWRAWRISLT